MGENGVLNYQVNAIYEVILMIGGDGMKSVI